MSAPRIIVQIIIAGGTILAKAFAAAYKQAAINAAQSSKNAAANAAPRTASNLTRQTGMTIEEARQILNVRKDSDVQEINKKYEHLFRANEQSQGGSPYLQAKVFRAKERIDLEAKLETNEGKPVGSKTPTPS